jgi:hypothetical protein
MKNPTKLSKRILIILICALFAFCLAQGVLAQGTVVKAEASTTQPQVGSTLTVTIKISNVQNLAGLDTTLTWNPAVLNLKSSALNLGDSHSDGVLHGSNIKTDVSDLNAGDIFAMEIKVSGSYNLVATESGKTTQAFSGSGTIVTLTFNAIKAGSASLSLKSELSDFSINGQPANLIDHQDIADTVTVVAVPTSETSTTPGFASTAIVAIFIALFAAAAVLIIRQIYKHRTTPSQKPL